jgi:hypothetical protein
MVLFVSSVILAIISLMVNVFELLLVNNYLYIHYAWGDIPLAGLPWLASLGFLVSAILLGIIAERENK